MLSLNEILNLDTIQSSIKKIDLFLTDQVKLSDEYMLALAYKGNILHILNKDNEALKLLLPFINDFKIMGSSSVLAVCDVIIKIYLDSMRFDEASKYINLKKNYLPASKLHLYLKDKIQLFLKMDDKKKAKEALMAYLSDDLMREEAIFAKEELAKIYFEEKDYDKYLEISKSLEDYYSENVYLDKVAALHLKELEISFLKGNYLKAVTDGNKFLEETSRVDYILICASICIKAYIELEDFKRAGIFESYYEDYATEEHAPEALMFSEAALSLYKKTNSLVSIKEYEERIKRLNEYLKPKEKKDHRRKKEEALLVANIEPTNIKPSESFITPSVDVLNKPSTPNLSRVEVVGRPKEVKSLIVSSSYNKISSIIDEINSLEPDLKLRELFRRLMIKASKELGFIEAYLLTANKGYNGLYYKKERAYDYTLDENYILKTINYAAIRYNTSLILDLEADSYSFDIRGKEYSDLDNVIAFPLKLNQKPLASICYYFEGDIKKIDLIYEELLLISSFINNRLIMDLYKEDIINSNRKLNFINDNMSSGLKEEVDSKIHLSKRAMEILSQAEDISEEDYFKGMNTFDIALYKKALDEIYTYMNNDLMIEYSYKTKDRLLRIKERFYPENIDGTIYIYSLIDDITKEYNMNEELRRLAYKNPASDMETTLKLEVDLNKEMPKEKLSLAICELSDFNLYKEIYGYNFSNQLIYAISLGLKEALSDDFTVNLYHMGLDRFAILFKDSNDKRLIDSKLNKAFNRASKALNNLNKRLNVSFNCGVFRLSKNTRIKKYDEVIKYALDALYDSLDLLGSYPHICHYNSDLTKERIKRSLLITHISEAIDSNNLSLTYQQIVDLSKESVFGYNAIINLDNLEVDRDYMNMVIDRRNLRKRIDRYAISRLFIEERMLYDKLKGYLNIFIYLKEISLDNLLYEYILTLKDHYKIDLSYITIAVDHANNPIVKELRRLGFKICSYDILDIYRESCDYLIYSYKDVGKDSIDEVRDLSIKHNVRCILGDIDNKDDIKLVKEKSYDLIYGSYYKKLNRIKDIINKIE